MISGGTPNFSGLLVVPLNNKLSTWLDLFNKQLPWLMVCSTLDQFHNCKGPKILLLHYEEVPPLIQKLRKIKWTFIGYDEVQRLKDRSSLASRRAAMLAHSAEYKVALSGTPMDDSPKDLWAIFRFLNPAVFGTRWKDFEDEYLEPIDDMKLKRYKPGTSQWFHALKLHQIKNKKRSFRSDRLDQFLKLIGPYCIRETSDVLNLPPMTITEQVFRLQHQQAVAYNEMERSYCTGNTTAVNAGARLWKLHQICGDFVKSDDGQVERLGYCKTEALCRTLVRHRPPFVIFCRYLHEVEHIARIMSREYDVATFTGKTPKPARERIKKAFQEGRYDAIIVQVKTGGVGIDLFRACVGIVYSLPPSYIDFDQMIKRLHRRGQTQPVKIILLIAYRTVDEDLYGLIKRKRRFSTKVLTQMMIQRRKTYG